MQHLLGLTQTSKDSYSLLQEENCVLKNPTDEYQTPASNDDTRWWYDSRLYYRKA